jgi:hypothetical protein
MLNKLNFKVGHYKNCTVILCPNGTTGCSAFGLIRKRK